MAARRTVSTNIQTMAKNAAVMAATSAMQERVLEALVGHELQPVFHCARIARKGRRLRYAPATAGG